MNRPRLEDYKAFVKDGLIIPRLAQYAVDLENYCDALEQEIKHLNSFIDARQVETTSMIEVYERALDKACKLLSERSDNLNEECWMELLFEDE